MRLQAIPAFRAERMQSSQLSVLHRLSFAILVGFLLLAAPAALRAQGVSFISTANVTQQCTGDAIQPLGSVLLTPSNSGKVVANSAIFLSYGGKEISGTPAAQGTGAGSVTLTMSDNTVIIRFNADVNYAPGDLLTINGINMATLGLTLGTSVPVSFSATGTLSNPITFTAPQRIVMTMIDCSMSVDSGDQQIGTVDTVLPTPLAILFSPCKPGTIVTFSVSAGGGSVSPTSAAVDANSKAATSLRLGQKIGTNIVTAKSVLSFNQASFSALGTPAAAANMSIFSGNDQTGITGQQLPQPFVIKVVDQFENPVPRVPFLLEVQQGGGLLAFASGETENNGLFQTFFRLGTTPGLNVVRATSPFLPDKELFFNATAQPLVATNLLLISGNNQTGVPGQPIQPFVVRVVGAGAVPIGAANVLFAVTAGGGSLTTLEATTDANGIASTILTLGPQQGINTVTATSGSLAGSPITFNALGTTSGQAQVIYPGGIVNGASFRPAADANGKVAPGSIVALFGSEMAQAQLNATSTPLPTTLGDTTVTFNGIAAPLFFVSPGQINAQVPWGVAPGEVAVRIRRGFLDVPSQSIQLASVSPGIFTANSSGTGLGAILHADTFQPVTSQSPTAPGRRIAVFATGLGPVSPAAVTGQPAPTPAPTTVSSVLATIAGTPAVVEFSGLAPGFVGLYQVNLVIPAGIPAGDQELQFIMNGVPSNTVLVPVQ